jgi:hypothetical protein
VKIYVASSWRCKHQPRVVTLLRSMGHWVYDFRNPVYGLSGFSWSNIDPDWINWSPEVFRNSLKHPIARAGLERDMSALESCDACLLVLPCGRSAHFELGLARGLDKLTAIYIPEQQEPELMYAEVDEILVSESELLDWGRRHLDPDSGPKDRKKMPHCGG